MPSLSQEQQNNTLEFLVCIFFTILIIAVSFSSQVQARMVHLSPFDLLLLSLATFRLTRLFVYDGIMQFVRDLFLRKKEIQHDGEVEVKREKPRGGIARLFADLLACPWCTGMWMALLVLSLFVFFPESIFLISVLAIAGLSTLIQIGANLIGWKAEGEKKEVKNM